MKWLKNKFVWAGALVLSLVLVFRSADRLRAILNFTFFSCVGVIGAAFAKVLPWRWAAYVAGALAVVFGICLWIWNGQSHVTFGNTGSAWRVGADEDNE